MRTFAAFRTTVLYVPPSPKGLVGDRWVVEHHCCACGEPIPRSGSTLTLNAELVNHAERCSGVRP